MFDVINAVLESKVDVYLKIQQEVHVHHLEGRLLDEGSKRSF